MLDQRGGGTVLQQLIASGNAVVRLRVLSLIILVGATSSAHASMLSDFGTPILMAHVITPSAQTGMDARNHESCMQRDADVREWTLQA